MNIQRKQSGFTILETIVVLIVMAAIISASSVYIKRNADNSLNQTAAANLQKLTQAAKWYTKDNYSTLKNSGTTTFSVAELIDKKYLEEGFSKVNSYGQGYQIIIQPDAQNSDMLQVKIITENGSAITTENMRKIAAIAGSDAGYALNTNTITGNQEAWELTGQSISKGHLASVTYVTGNDIVSAENFLRRDKIDGHPEWNQMNTDLTMTKNNSIIAESDKGNAVFDGQQLVFNDVDSAYSATLNGENLTFTKGSNKTSISNNNITVADGSNTTLIDSDKISTGEVIAKNMTADGKIQGETIIGDNVISYSYQTPVSKSEDPEGRLRSKGGMFSTISSDYVKVPLIHTNYYWSHTSSSEIKSDSAKIANRVVGCDGSLASQGRMVMVGSNTVGHKVLLICSEATFKAVSYMD